MIAPAIYRAVILLVSAHLIACARQGPPPGGPRDTSAPEVLAVSPESLAVGVPQDAPIELVFGEKIDPKTMEMALWVTPGGTSKPRIDVSGEKVTIRLSEPLPESTTVGVLLTTVIKDRKREGQQNRMVRPYRWIFSTGDRIDPGSIRGVVKRVGGGAGSGHLLVGLYPALADTLPDPLSTLPLAITEADTSGDFVLEGIPVNGELGLLFSMYDRNGDREVRGLGEFVSATPESIRLTPERPDAVVNTRLVDPEAPGHLQGSMARADGDTTAIWLELFAADGDSLASPSKRSQAGTDGAFSFRQVPPGDYRVVAFCDINENKKRDPEEDAVSYGAVTITAGDTRELGEWTAPRCVP